MMNFDDEIKTLIKECESYIANIETKDSKTYEITKLLFDCIRNKHKNDYINLLKYDCDPSHELYSTYRQFYSSLSIVSKKFKKLKKEMKYDLIFICDILKNISIKYNE